MCGLLGHIAHLLSIGAHGLIGRQDHWEKDHWEKDDWATKYVLGDSSKDDWATTIYYLIYIKLFPDFCIIYYCRGRVGA